MLFENFWNMFFKNKTYDILYSPFFIVAKFFQGQPMACKYYHYQVIVVFLITFKETWQKVIRNFYRHLEICNIFSAVSL